MAIPDILVSIVIGKHTAEAITVADGLNADGHGMAGMGIHVRVFMASLHYESLTIACPASEMPPAS